MTQPILYRLSLGSRPGDTSTAEFQQQYAKDQKVLAEQPTEGHAGGAEVIQGGPDERGSSGLWQSSEVGAFCQT